MLGNEEQRRGEERCWLAASRDMPESKVCVSRGDVRCAFGSIPRHTRATGLRDVGGQERVEDTQRTQMERIGQPEVGEGGRAAPSRPEKEGRLEHDAEWFLVQWRRRSPTIRDDRET